MGASTPRVLSRASSALTAQVIQVRSLEELFVVDVLFDFVFDSDAVHYGAQDIGTYRAVLSFGGGSDLIGFFNRQIYEQGGSLWILHGGNID